MQHTIDHIPVTLPVSELVDKYELDRLWGEKATANLKTVLSSANNGVMCGISGKIGSGKDSVAKALVEKDCGFSKVIAFADPLRDEIDQLINAARGASLPKYPDVSVEELSHIISTLESALKNNPEVRSDSRVPEIRHALQYWGTDVRRKRDDLYWVKRTVWNALEYAFASGCGIIVSDVRFPNEAQMIHDFAGKVFRIEASHDIRKTRLEHRDMENTLTQASAAHQSETALDDWTDFDFVYQDDSDKVADIAQVLSAQLTNN